MLVVMAEGADLVGESMTAAELRALAAALKRAAVRAGRPDVAAKTDEILALLKDPGEQKPVRGDAGNTVVKILDGLGF